MAATLHLRLCVSQRSSFARSGSCTAVATHQVARGASGCIQAPPPSSGGQGGRAAWPVTGTRAGLQRLRYEVIHLHLQFESKPDKPDLVYAHKLQELIGGAYGEMTVTMQYLLQGWNCRMRTAGSDNPG